MTPSEKPKRNIQKKIILESVKLLGRPYKYGAKNEDTPNYFDCSLFVKYIFGKFGINLARSSNLQALCGKEVAVGNPELWEIGDLLFFKGHRPRTVILDNRELLIGHVAIYIGNRHMTHCSSKRGVEIKPVPGTKHPVVLVKRII
ncbi:MAG: hypothetical protein A2745_01705 [Candidatus Harrisonbacteria bacterium RIFCSPHIGHO2_01_FULL_44_13]|uniref:NlpC/P60 domain-containing protein n=1 Tax=Candidatus Harrisonbacteria bacterium RIFCSPLOWO2_01_FULL_44_18 TaxID=1798407 RepID=A0A1G1ZN51_9BACT|nr:MAG: hypothetical protein A2745_01705 [Candidatus Harrisonbacteria bacterium RIFCSPHIGHO2_01_FULL_44_13]OGY65190.1 MAG: hypothetical protein A3A16_00665 [Candidatus Harrisonbacteria bacterium RIFCSPLOWO2_01_FULL_44_18]